ncbi:glycosyltransferase [Persicitalea sp.]|uniref:glycosyltransferase n=1 Tax=Persicitalea sp. TaxID=3100273 RepID=UPI003593DC7C
MHSTLPLVALLLIILTSTYALFTLALWLYWQNIPASRSLENSPTTRITVIIPVRNEASHIGELLSDLAQQTHEQNLFEVIVADDGSTDNTPYVLKTFKKNSQLALTVIELDQDIRTASPKKRAIETALRRATGELIVTTDGDCRVGPDWLISIAETYRATGAKLISGPVTFTTETTLTDHLQTVEFSSLIGSGAASISAGSPSMCNGANLAYEKKTFEEVGGFTGNEHLASGDDEFLMHKIAERYPGKIHFIKDRRAIVQTTSHSSWKDFFQQRKRWASKWKHYKNPVSTALAIYIFICNAALIAGLILGFTELVSWQYILLLFAVKWLPEWILIGSILSFLRKSRSIIYIPVVQVIYPFYVSLFGLAAQQPKYIWKGRTLR